MKVVILAGGYGSRLSEETQTIPKPLVSIGEFPIIWHIMKIYSHYGFNDFLICLGYKGDKLKEYFLNYLNIQSDLSLDFQNDQVKHVNSRRLNWKVTLVNTGIDTMTGGRLSRILKFLDGPFHCTYGDGLASLNITDLVAYHKRHGKKATITAVRPPARFGALEIQDGQVSSPVKNFSEKPIGDKTWINGGFFIFDPAVVHKSIPDDTVLETDILTQLAQDGDLMAFKHHGFWHPMDTVRDRANLEKMWLDGNADWKIWED